MDRRRLLQGAVAAALLPSLRPACAETTAVPFTRARPGDTAWPSEADWQGLAQQVGGRLARGASPLGACRADAGGPDCAAFFKELRNPYFISDNPDLTQTTGWVDAWTSSPSAYILAASETADVVAAVNFARQNNLRLAVKGGGHSYQGTSNSADSLLIWTRHMDEITLHDAFVPQGCAGAQPTPAVTLGAGVRWMAAYDAVTTKAGRYVQGGGCATVGVAGLIQSGGFGSFSKQFGQAASNLLEAEVVVASGEALTVNACAHPELFWALKGGGGGSLGVITRITLRTHDLPEWVAFVSGKVSAASNAAFQTLIARMLRHYSDTLLNPHWGEQFAFGADNSLTIAMVSQGLDAAAARAAWQPLLDWLAENPADYTITTPINVGAGPMRHVWDAAYLNEHAPGMLSADDRPGAPAGNVYWTGDGHEAGHFLHGYKSAWVPAALLSGDQTPLANAIFAATRHWKVAFHCNKGLAGATPDRIAAARDTAMNPDVLDAFALAILGGGGPPAFPGIPGHEPDLAAARADAEAIGQAMAELLKVAPGAGSYVSESDYFAADWQDMFWGVNYPRLAAAKAAYDPGGLFFVHHGVGSEQWSPDGFTRLAAP